MTGPSLRGSGVNYDIRKIDPYSIYPDIDFKACVRKDCDSYARYLVRIDEIKESLHILRQLADTIPAGDIITTKSMEYLPRQERLQRHDIFPENIHTSCG